MDANAERFFVLTGGPGSGKSTLIAALEAAGYAGTVEAGRAIIRDQAAIGGPALPWSNPALFAEAMLAWEMRSWRLACAERGPVFFDRGVPDVAGYLRLLGRPVPLHVERAGRAFRYAPTVFLAPPWPEIYRRDGERRQDFDEAVRTFEAMAETYARCGYRTIDLPRAEVDERVRFVLRTLGLPRPG